MNIQGSGGVSSITNDKKIERMWVIFDRAGRADIKAIQRYLQGEVKFESLSKEQVGFLHRSSNFLYKRRFEGRPDVKEEIKSFLVFMIEQQSKRVDGKGRKVARREGEPIVNNNKVNDNRYKNLPKAIELRDENFDPSVVQFFEHEILGPLIKKGVKKELIQIMALIYIHGDKFYMPDPGWPQETINRFHQHRQMLGEEKSEQIGKYIQKYLKEAEELYDVEIIDDTHKGVKNNKVINQPYENKGNDTQPEAEKVKEVNKINNQKILAGAEKNDNPPQAGAVSRKAEKTQQQIEEELSRIIISLIKDNVDGDFFGNLSGCVSQGEAFLIDVLREHIPIASQWVCNSLKGLMKEIKRHDRKKYANYINLEYKRRIREKENRKVLPNNFARAIINNPEIKNDGRIKNQATESLVAEGNAIENSDLPKEERLYLSLLTKFLAYLKDRYDVQSKEELLKKHFDKYFYHKGCDRVKDHTFDGLLGIEGRLTTEEITFMAKIFLPGRVLNQGASQNIRDYFFEFITEFRRNNLMNLGAFLGALHYKDLKDRLV